MFGQETPVDETVAIDQKAQVFQSATELRDQLFEGNQGAMIKVIGGTLIGLFFLYRFLLK